MRKKKTKTGQMRKRNGQRTRKRKSGQRTKTISRKKKNGNSSSMHVGGKLVEFCPKCGKLLIPTKKEGKIFLLCRNCSYEKPASESKGYKIVQPVDEGKRRKTLVVEEPQIKKGKKKTEEERELMADYYEVFLENFQEEGGEEEGSSEENEME
ncbi:MAG: hypothetical protein ABSF36_07310 [Candidatus Methanomethylicaceae archaeon]